MKTSNNPFIRSLTGAFGIPFACAGMVLAMPAALADENARNESPEVNVAADSNSEDGTAISGNLHFTDEQGNRRQPTAEEVREAAEAFQRDLARLAGKHKGKPDVETRPDGTVSATIAASKLVFLTVVESDDGELRYGHSTMDEDGNVSFEPTASFPEK